MQEGKEKDKKGTNNCLKFYTPAYYCPIHFPHGLLSLCTLECVGRDGHFGRGGKEDMEPQNNIPEYYSQKYVK